MKIETNNIDKLTAGLLIAVLFISMFNIYQVRKLEHTHENMMTGMATQNVALKSSGSGSVSQNSANMNLAGIDVLPKGVPDIYGNELSVSFDDVSAANAQKADATIRKLGVLDQSITLSGKDLERYIAVASQMSCEYCCAAPSIIDAKGKAACGCAHSFAMRGLTKYLITKHGGEYTDDQILEELGKWKTLFFPGKLQAKAAVLKEKGIEFNYINLASNKYRGIEKNLQASGQNSGAMVGGC